MIEELLSELKLFGALDYYCNQYEEGTKDSFNNILKLMLMKERHRRSDNALKRRLSNAKFPYIREWEQIDQNKNKKIPFAKIKKLSSGDFIKKNMNLCLIGAPGLEIGRAHV